MATPVTLNGVTYSIPQQGDDGWADAVSNYLIALSTGVLSRAGGSFTLNAEANFGATHGIRTAYVKSHTLDVAASGVLRLANGESVAWRNANNNADIALRVNESDQLEFAGEPVVTLAHGPANTALVMNSDGTAFQWAALTDANIASAAAIAVSKLASLTSNRAVITSGSGVLSASDITTTELEQLSGIESNIQDQLDALDNRTLDNESDINDNFNDLQNHKLATTTHGVSGNLVGTTDTQTLSSKSIDADTNTLTNIADSAIKADAAIARTKLASGPNDHVVINSDSGVLSSEAVLAKVRGGTGADNSNVTFPSTGTLVTRDSTDDLSNKTFSDELRLTELAETPTTPSAGQQKVYPRTNGKLYVLDSDGREKEVGSGSGSGEINYIDSPNTADGWGTLGSGIVVSTTTEPTEIPRYPLRDTGIKIAPGDNTSGEVFTQMTVAEVDLYKLLKVEWQQLVGPAFQDGDYVVQVWANEQADYEGDWIALLEKPINALQVQHFEFVPGHRYLELVIQKDNASDDTDKWMSISDIVLGPGRTASGAVIGTDEPYPDITCTITTNATTEATWNQVGDKANFQIRTVFSGANTDGSAAYSGIDIDDNRLTGERTVIGKWYLRGNSAANSYSGIVYYTKSTGNVALSTPSGGVVNTSTNTPRTIASGDEITVQLDNVPLVSLRNKGTTQYLTPEVLYASARADYRFGGGTQNPSPGTPVRFINPSEDAITWIGEPFDNVDGLLTTKIAGTYTIAASLRLTDSFPQGALATIRKNGSVVAAGSPVAEGARYAAVTGTLSLEVGDEVAIHVTNAAGSNAFQGNISSDTGCRLTLTRIADQTAGSAVGNPLAGVDRAGLLAPPTMLDDATATMLGLKVYQHGTLYNGGNSPTITTHIGGALTSVSYSSFIPYQLQDGSWRMKFNFAVTVESGTRDRQDMAIAGLAAGTSMTQSITASQTNRTGAYYVFAFFNPATGRCGFQYLDEGNVETYQYSGDVALNKKPDWAY